LLSPLLRTNVVGSVEGVANESERVVKARENGPQMPSTRR